MSAIENQETVIQAVNSLRCFTLLKMKRHSIAF